MSAASDRNLALAMRERDRRTALSLDSPGTPGVAQAGYLGPGWDAFYGSLREGAGGGGYRLTGNGMGGSVGGDSALGGGPTSLGFRTERPGDEDIARTLSINGYLGSLDDKRRLADQQLQQEQARTDLVKTTAAGAAEDLTDRETMDRALTGGGAVDRARLLASVPGHLRPDIEAQLSASDAKLLNEQNDQRKLAETERHNKAGEAVNAPFTQPKDANGQPVMGDALLQTLPQGQQTMVTRIIEGKQAIPTGAALKDPYWKNLIETAGLVDPSFDTVNYNARNKAFTDLSSPSGAGGKTIGALNTAASHIGKLSDLVEKLDNFDVPMANRIRNPILSETGDTRVTNFNVNQPQTMKEIESLWKASGGTQADIDKLKESLGPNMGKTQQREALAGFADLMLGKLESTQQQRDSVLGPVASKKVPILFEKSMPALRQIYERAGKEVPDILGGKPAVPTGAGSSRSALPPLAAGEVYATDPQGNVHKGKEGTPLPAGWKLGGG